MSPSLGTPPVALITGASRGIGLAMGHGLAAQGWRLVSVARDPARLDAACAEMQRRYPGCIQQRAALDLSDLASLRDFAQALLSSGLRLRCLMHNAGVICMRRELTPQGLERTWATNVVAPHLLTRLLTPALPDHAVGRVIFMSSLVRRWGVLKLDDPGLAHGYTPDRAYNQSKLAVMLLAQAFAGRSPGWLSVSMEPGMTATDFGSNYRGFRAVMRALWRPFMATPEEAADTAVWLATAPSAALASGGHYIKRRREVLAPGLSDPTLLSRLVERLDDDAR